MDSILVKEKLHFGGFGGKLWGQIVLTSWGKQEYILKRLQVGRRTGSLVIKKWCLDFVRKELMASLPHNFCKLHE